MRPRKVAVLGAGPAGLAASLVLARNGHNVTLIERDPIDVSGPEEAFSWERKGIPHFMQPHSLIPRGRLEMIEHFGDVYASLIREGANEIDLRRKLPGAPEPADADLQYLSVRRPLIEWGLRKAVLEQHGIKVHSRIQVRGTRVERGTVAGIEVDGGAMDIDVVIDAMGRGSPTRGWLTPQGCAVPRQERSECGVIYYSRYYRLRPSRELPDGPWLLSPRGDLGYMAYATFPGDNGTFAAVLAVPTGVPELKIFKHESAYQAAIGHIPLLKMWTDPGLVEPITPVLPMGGLQNTISAPDEDLPIGLFPAADALCHTDPVLAHGLSFSMIHAVEIARAIQTHEDLSDAFAAYSDAVMPALRERYDLATALDEQRLRMWTGGPVDFTHKNGDHALFTMMAAGAAAMVDPEVFRAFVRRIGLLDSTRVLDEDKPLQERIEALFREMLAKPRPASGPSRGEMLSLAEEAIAG